MKLPLFQNTILMIAAFLSSPSMAEEQMTGVRTRKREVAQPPAPPPRQQRRRRRRLAMGEGGTGGDGDMGGTGGGSSSETRNTKPGKSPKAFSGKRPPSGSGGGGKNGVSSGPTAPPPGLTCNCRSAVVCIPGSCTETLSCRDEYGRRCEP